MEKALRIAAIFTFILSVFMVFIGLTGGTDIQLGFGFLMAIGGFMLLAMRGVLMRMDKLTSKPSIRPGPWDRGDS
ncbi:hypothetical protein [Oceanicaulis sp.]|uniref:hypothetical protein n=1 Tax=Oceanicaulis sp. TaxID=1924941 RepID=UPI003F709417